MRSFSGCGREPWVPLICVGDLRQLLRVPLRSQGHCGFGRGLSLLNWVWCNRRGPHLEWRQEPQGSSPFLTRVAEYPPSTDKRVTPRLPWRNGSPLAFRVVHGVTGHLLSCVWNLRVFPDDAQGCQCPFCCTFIHRVVFKEVSGHRVLLKSVLGNRGLSACGTPHEATSRNFP